MAKYKFSRKEIIKAIENPVPLNIIYFEVNPDDKLSGAECRFVDENGYCVGINLDARATKWMSKRLKKIGKYLEEE